MLSISATQTFGEVFSFRRVGGSKRDSKSGKEVGLEKEVGDSRRETGAQALRGKEKADPGPGRCLTPLSEPHPAE